MTADPFAEPLREVIARHGLSARKGLGQHFLLDLNLTRRIARAAGDLTDASVLEIGPGPGGLTRALLETGASRVIAVERDPRCIEALAGLAAADTRLKIVEGDALAIDERALLANEPGRVKVVANLPYNIGTALLVKWLTVEPWPPWYESLTLMFQHEVAQRLTAAPRTKAYGRLSVLAQWRAEIRHLLDVPARAFTPPPKVSSTVVALIPRPAPLEAPLAALQAVTAAAFGQRRKMLRSSLATLPGGAGLLASAGLDPTARAETLSVDDFCALARAYEANAEIPAT